MKTVIFLGVAVAILLAEADGRRKNNNTCKFKKRDACDLLDFRQQASEQLEKAVRQIGFEAFPTVTNEVTGESYQRVVYDHVALNAGEAYDSSTGIFTVPRSGLYYFQAILSTLPHKMWSSVVIKKNNEKVLCYTYNEPNQGRWQQTVASTVARVEAQDQIQVFLRGNLAFSNVRHHINSAFSGFLIAED